MSVVGKPVVWLALSALALLVYVLLFTPNVPIADQWEGVPYFLTHGWQSALGQINQHRTIIPNLITLALAKATHWNLKVEAAAAWFFLSVLMIAVYLSFAALVSDRNARRLFGLVMLSQLSPIHHENILWVFSGIVFSSCLVYLALSVLLFSRQTWGALGLLIAASFSFISGLLGWLPAYYVAHRSRRGVSLLLVGSVLCLSVYFAGNRAVGSEAGAAGSAIAALQYFLIFFGALFFPTHRLGPWQGPVLCLSGLIGLAALAAGTYLLIKTRQNNERALVLPRALIGYALLNALAIVLGRSGFGLEGALLSRYHLYQSLYYVSLAWLGIVHFGYRGNLARYDRLISGGLILLTIYFWLGGLGLGYFKQRKYAPAERELKARGERISDSAAQLLYYEPARIRPLIRLLREKKYGPFRE
ncbi:MAG: hypothetical protein MUC35_04985 [Candidatus Margulisbacteria bacterium]|jgi:hypothetical protein|nr:hypothetical protein [Candidatus Margulisiibacteriota bacterium]